MAAMSAIDPDAALAGKATLLRRFPKVRPPLPPRHAAFHETFYKAAREGGHAGASVALRLERWMHRRAAEAPAGFPLLEIGAGTLNHVPFERARGVYDAVEPLEILYGGQAARTRLRALYHDIAEVPAGESYARIVSIATLEHVTDLPNLVARAALHLEADGEFRAGIPSEGGLLWYLAYTFGTGLTFRLKYGMSYSTFMRHEHVNTAEEIESVVALFFDRVAVRRFPLPFLNASVYSHLAAKGPRVEVARRYLETASGAA